MDVALNVDTGEISFQVGSVPDLGLQIPVVVTMNKPIIQTGVSTPGGQDKRIQKEFQTSINNAVANCREQAPNHLQKFIYPVNGQFKVKNPILTTDGNVLADVSYLP